MATQTKVHTGSQENLYTSEDEEGSDEERLPLVQGNLNKWTNLLHGWQERFFVLKDGLLAYYRSEEEMGLGCRGAIRLRQAYVRPHEYDECRFEVRVGDSIWYLRGANMEERLAWIQAVERHRIAESGYGSEQNVTLGRHSSLISINSSASLSIASASSFKRGHGLKEKLAEMDTFKDILCKQVDSLQGYFDACSAIVRHAAHDQLEMMNDLDDSAGDSDMVGDVISHAFGRDDSCSSSLQHEENDDVSLGDVSNNSGGAPAPVPAPVPAPPVVPPISHHHTLLYQRHRRVGSHPGRFRLSTDGEVVDETVIEEEELPLGSSPTPAEPRKLATEWQRQLDQASAGSKRPSQLLATGPVTSSSQVVEVPVVTSPPEPTSTITVLTSTVSHQSFPTNYDNQQDATTPTSQPSVIIAQQAPRAGFLSRFFPFRSNAQPTSVNQGSVLATNTAPSEMAKPIAQYRPSSRFNDLKRILEQHGGHALDFKGEACTFKATTTGIITNLSHCIELMQQREDQWRKRLEREIEKRRRAEDAYRLLSHDLSRLPPKMVVLGGPDFEEGPNCTIGEEEFFDAIDAQLDKMECDDQRLEALKIVGSELLRQGAMISSHPLYTEVNRVVQEHLQLCDPTNRELKAEDGWQIIAQDGEMVIYKREMENSEGMVLDPLQAMHVVEGVTARELCSFFWDVQYRMDWEITVDQPPRILEACGEDTIVLHQVYKRIWPASQRDSVFWSHMRKVDLPQVAQNNDSSDKHPPASDMWMVMNMSTDYKAPPLDEQANKMIRLELDVAFICQTIIDPLPSEAAGDSCPLTRDRIRSRLLYASSINPGGWAPASVLRTMAKREYPRFIKRFSQYVIDQTAGKPVMM